MANTKMTNEEMMMQILDAMKENNTRLGSQQADVLKGVKTVPIKNLMPFGTSFATDKKPKGYLFEGDQINTQLTVAELEEQVNMGNVAFCGIDGKGNHATLQILDDIVRKELLGNDEPYYFTEEEMKRLLDIKNPAEFNAEVDRCVIKYSEARALSHYICSKYGESNLYGWQKNAIDAKLKSFM